MSNSSHGSSKGFWPRKNSYVRKIVTKTTPRQAEDVLIPQKQATVKNHEKQKTSRN